MTRLFRTALAAAGAATLLVAPANAAAQGTCATTYSDADSDGTAHWFNGNPAGTIPTDVDLNDVGADGTKVLAVGSNGTSAVVYRRTTGDWQSDPIQLPAATTSSTLDQVAVTPNTAWAIGTRTDATGAVQPLVLRFDSGAWKAPTQPFPGTLPTAIGALGNGGYIGDKDGDIHRFVDAGGGTYSGKFEAPSAGPINAVSMYPSVATGTGFTGANWGPLNDNHQEDTTVRLYRMSAGVGALEVARPATDPKVDIISIAASSGETAVALDRTGHVWRLEDSLWTREADGSGLPSGSDGTLAEIAARNSTASSVTEAIAGRTSALGGMVWTRQRATGETAPWSCAALSAPALNAVAVLDGQNMWAVGDDGTVRRLWAKPTPDADADGVADRTDNCHLTHNPDQAENDGDGAGNACDGDDDNDGLLDEADNCQFTSNADQADDDADGIGNACDPTDDRPRPVVETSGGTGDTGSTPDPGPTTTSTTGTTSGTVETTVDQPKPDPPKPEAKKKPRRLLTNLRVERRGRALVVKFRLTGRARVAITALRNGKIISKTGFHKLRKGKRKLVVRFRGKPPSNLKVVVRPVGKRRSS